jgi:serine/threonine protein kinase
MSIDLKPYGIDHIFKSSQTDFKWMDKELCARGSYDKAGQTFTINGQLYTLVETIGEGTFGAAYKVKDKTGKFFAIKQIKDKLTTGKDVEVFLKEVLIQILLWNESKDVEDGPYVPTVISIGFDPVHNEAFIVFELMHNTIYNLCKVLTKEENDIMIPHILDKVAKILDFFGKTLDFNHRDLKPDNIMYTKNKDNKRVFKLIDFGFACLTWHGIKITGGTYFSAARLCYKQERDLAQLCYYMYRYMTTLSPELKRWILKVLESEYKGRKCTLGDGCQIHGIRGFDTWYNTYNFFDRENVKPLYTSPGTFMRKTRYFKEKKKFNSPLSIKEPATCPPGKELGAKGKCKVAPAASIPLLVEGPCPPGKILNPKTGRCVKEDGNVGKIVLRHNKHNKTQKKSRD